VQELSRLFKRYLNNECTPEEIRMLLDYFNVDNDNADLKLLIEEQLYAEVPADFEEQPEVIAAFRKTDSYLQQQLFKKSFLQRVFSSGYTKYAVAASLAGILLLGMLFYSRLKKSDFLGGKQLAKDVRPGTNKGILTLADGSSIVLDANSDTTLLKRAGVSIKVTKEGLVVYQVSGQQSETTEVLYNRITTPKGGQYTVILSDGTKVMLNASSSLRYPLTFPLGLGRKVELNGEGFFDVEKVMENGFRKPFSVETPTQIVEVLGTHFNVSAYDDDLLVKTTLVSGKVNVYSIATKEGKILNPGEQSVLTAGDPFIYVKKVNVEGATAWKDGNFMFEDLYLKDIMKQLSRWYNVEVDLKNLPETRYNIFISRNETLSNVLRMLEKTGNIKFSLINNTIKINR
jgi:transmembrane sensor